MHSSRAKFSVVFFLLSTTSFAQINNVYRSPTVALENFDFESINYTTLDSSARDYIKAMEHCLFHRYNDAEPLLKKWAIRSDISLGETARFYLLNELYFWRGRYTNYVHFADIVNKKDDMYSLARKLAAQPSTNLFFSKDSLLIPVNVLKHSYVVVNVKLNGQPAKLILDSGANLSILSQKMSKQLGLTMFAALPITNSLKTTTGSSVAMLDSLSLGNSTVKNLPILCPEKDKLFKQRHVDGLLGWDVLRQLSYTIDFPNKTLLIRKPVMDSIAEKNLFGINLPILTVHTSSGIRLNMFFDSGSDSVDLTTKGASKLGNYKTTTRPGTIQGIGTSKVGFLQYVKNFTFVTSGKVFTRRRTYLSPVEHISLNIKTDGVLSNAPFQKGRLTIDYLNNHFDYRE